MNDSQKLLIIGLDGATWDILMPLIKMKKLSTLEKLVKNGSWGILESTVPPVTGSAWLAIATGKTPGKTGIIDFLNKKDDSYKLYPTTSSDFKGHSFWDYLSKANKKVGIFNYPMLYPPYKVNGFMISGLGSSPDDDISYPPALKEELEYVTGKYEIYVDYHNKKYENLDLFISDLNNFLEKFEKWIYYLVKNKEWDTLFLVFSATDWVQHIMWRHIDDSHPLYEPKVSPKYKKEFIKFWQRIDKILGNLLRMVKDDTIVFLVSDHGFGPNDQMFNLAKWLEMKGYMVRKRNIKKLIKKYAYKSATIVAKTPLRKLFSTKTRKSVGNVLRTSIADEIDFEKSKAYCLGHTIPFGAIYINASNEKEREEIKARLLYDLKNISKDIGKEVEVQIYEPKKLYSGEKVNLLPDIIFTINNWRCVIIEDNFDKPLFEEKPFSTRHTGSHRLNGIFLAYGPGIKKGQRVDAKICDIAPTILHIFGLPIPNDMDGRVLMEIFEEDSEFAKRKQKYIDPSYYEKKGEDKKLKNAIKSLKLKGKI
ncbi:alkaline phosphatase family protein [Methanotorris formicicus]|uniref:Type I phosphodiesterase/nucleotide pyrophosphatase n=1 Tax=Methanotorris formicicus Mc-S-70 TaxID=647171 RepID=H1KZD3_9EURY|nr:alkaline phosphatase family protein [Methanotorris formicicus]EHP86159.1 type I phosphodiesterase/nucleotide pyrophosphatase [Methanotorris formicicus Mc-S-70]